MKLDDIARTRLAGACALTGGALRVVGAFGADALAEGQRQRLYFATDFFLTLGLIGIYLRYRERLRGTGLFGFVLSLSAVLVVRTSANNPGGYVIGAALFSFGMALIGAAALLGERKTMAAPVLWIASFAVGLLGQLLPGQTLSFLIASLLFSAGFIWSGVRLLRGV